MKKISTLVLGTLLTLAVSAADHRPTVTVNASYGSKYEIVVDGKSYMNAGSINLSYLRDGSHSIQVYQANRGFFFGKRKMMVASSSFQVRNNDIVISVDMAGQIRINESRFDMGRDKGWDKGKDKDQGRGNFDQHKRF